jgi:hypothetical protein
MVRLEVSQRGERHAGRLKFAILPRIHFGGSEAVCGREGVVRERCGETRRETEICDFTENSFLGERSGL